MANRSIPRFSPETVAGWLAQHYGLRGELTPLPSYRDQNFRLMTPTGRGWVAKIAHPDQESEVIEAQTRAMQHAAKRLQGRLLVPEVLPTLGDEIGLWVDGEGGRRHRFQVVSLVPGILAAEVTPWTPEFLRSWGEAVARLDQSLADFQHRAVQRTEVWDLAQVSKIQGHTALLPVLRRRYLAERVFGDLGEILGQVGDRLPGSVIHNDGNEHNVLAVDEGEGYRVRGLIDFGDLVKSRRVFGLAVAAAYGCLGRPDPLAAIDEIVAGYHGVAALEEQEIRVLIAGVRGRLATSVTLSNREAIARGDRADAYLTINSRPAWEALERLAGVDDEKVFERLSRVCGHSTVAVGSRGRSAEEILDVRRRHLGRNLSVSYREPLKIVRGHMQYLFDESGRAYVDGVNNVCHVGHCHPRVVEAAARQMPLLNTNTRYLHDHLAEYTERLASLFPDPLSVVFLVCTGSEANDLALRLARIHTGRRGVAVVDGAYHGHTGCLIELSPYKFDGPGGSGEAPHVRTVTMPDGYRQAIKHGDSEIGRRYAQDVARAADSLDEAGHGLAAFFCESMLGCGGQVELPPDYLRHAFEVVRQAGGVCLVDEVQVGFGRVGSHFWAFETQDVVPDIVTLGKPIGNGHPLAAVITTPEIADSFANGMEYFNTFGGNPVSCAVGMAVLDVIEEEGLQAHAQAVGSKLVAGLEELGTRHGLIGEVRGRGLFLGAELVRDRETLEPAAEEASWIIEAMKERGILLSTDGPLHNVLKIKPPLPFAEENADQLVTLLDEVLTQVPNFGES